MNLGRSWRFDCKGLESSIELTEVDDLRWRSDGEVFTQPFAVQIQSIRIGHRGTRSFVHCRDVAHRERVVAALSAEAKRLGPTTFTASLNIELMWFGQKVP